MTILEFKNTQTEKLVESLKAIFKTSKITDIYYLLCYSDF